MHPDTDRGAPSMEPLGSASGAAPVMPEEILGIALVVGGTSSGAQLVFRYPSMHANAAPAEGGPHDSQQSTEEVNTVCGIKAEYACLIYCTADSNHHVPSVHAHAVYLCAVRLLLVAHLPRSLRVVGPLRT